MRISTPVNKESLRNHWHYNNWKYLIMVAAMVFGWSLIYTVTAYRSPENKRIDVYVMTQTATQETMNEFLKPIWQEVAPEMEVVSAVQLIANDEYYTYTQLSTYIMAQEGDIYILDEQFFRLFAGGGAFLPLDALVADGTIDVSDVDLSKGYVTDILDYDEREQPIYGDRHLYGIPLDSFYGFMDKMQLDNRNLYAVILGMNRNDENVIPFFNAMLQEGRGEKPEWLNN